MIINLIYEINLSLFSIIHQFMNLMHQIILNLINNK